MEQRIEFRKKEFKKTFDPRRRREALQIRRENRETRLNKKRADAVEELTYAYRERLPSMIQALMSDDPETQYLAAKKFRRLLSVDRFPPIEEVIDTGAVPRLVQLLREGQPKLQFEAAWALTNIASGTVKQTEVVVNAGAVPIFIELLSSQSREVREQAVWGLGNISGDCPDCRDAVLQAGGLQPLLQQVIETHNSDQMAMLRNATWTLSNLCRGKPAPSFKIIEPAVAVLRELVEETDHEILTDTSWALSYISDGPDGERPIIINALIQANIVPRLVGLLRHPKTEIQTPALRTLGNIVTGNDIQTEVVIHANALPALRDLLTQSKKGSTKKEVCWTLSNITAGTPAQIQAVIQEGIIPYVIDAMKTVDFQVQREAAWTISNAISGGNEEQVKYLVKEGCVNPLCNLLSMHAEPTLLTVLLEAIERILKVGQEVAGLEGVNEYAHVIEEAGAFARLEELQMHTSSKVYGLALKIMTTYFQFEEACEDVNEQQAFGEMSSTGFNFGA